MGRVGRCWLWLLLGLVSPHRPTNGWTRLSISGLGPPRVVRWTRRSACAGEGDHGAAAGILEGSLVEVLATAKHTGGRVLGIVTGKKRNNKDLWEVLAADGRRRTVSAKRMKYIDSTLPGWEPVGGLADLRDIQCTTDEFLAPGNTLASSLWAQITGSSPPGPIPAPEREDSKDEGEGKIAVQRSALLAGIPGTMPDPARRYLVHRMLTSVVGQAYFREDRGSGEVLCRPIADVSHALALCAPVELNETKAVMIGEAIRSLAQWRTQGAIATDMVQAVREACRGLRGAYTDTYGRGIELEPQDVFQGIAEIRRLAAQHCPDLEPSKTDHATESEPRLAHFTYASRLMTTPALRAWSPTSEGAFNLMVELGVFSEHENLALIRSGLPHLYKFNDVVEREVRTILKDQVPQLERDLEARGRRDLRHLKMYTIDAPGSLDIDDGLSVERLTETGRLRYWVHIADAERWVQLGSELQQSALQRQTTLYLPTGELNMLPEALITQALSLARGGGAGGGALGTTKAALSIGVELDAEGRIIVERLVLCESLVRVGLRLGYADADDMLQLGLGGEKEPDWALGALHKAAILRRQWRAAHGCVTTQFPSAKVSVTSSSSIFKDASDVPSAPPEYASVTETRYVDAPLTMHPVDERCEVKVKASEDSYTEAQKLVMEMMIMSGEAIGLLGQAFKIPLPYRSQKASRAPRGASSIQEQADAVPEGFCRTYFLRKFFNKGMVSTKPAPHWALGVQAYVQWTSPIRRYTDLVVHYQLKEWLFARREGRSPTYPYSLKDMEVMINERSAILRDCFQVSRESQRYWVNEFFRRGMLSVPPSVYAGVILGVAPPSFATDYALLLPDLGLEVRLNDAQAGLAPNTQVQVQAIAAEPRGRTRAFIVVDVERSSGCSSGARYHNDDDVDDVDTGKIATVGGYGGGRGGGGWAFHTADDGPHP